MNHIQSTTDAERRLAGFDAICAPRAMHASRSASRPRVPFIAASFITAVVACALFAGNAVASPADDFFTAIIRDNPSSMSQVLKQGFDPNTLDAKGSSGLSLALKDGNKRAAEALWASPQLKIDLPNASNETPLMLAAIKGDMDWSRRLLDRGAAVNRPGWAPIHYAASSGESKVLALLLARGAEIEAESPNGTTAVMMAAGYGSEDAVELLRKRGADLKRRNQQGLNAADFARRAGREGLAQTLSTGS
ncbi:MAG: hypothetical protein JWQ11_1642 [Rhizobacter sp.]|nr:hypothetical protein [Rhizobacter sp.]